MRKKFLLTLIGLALFGILLNAQTFDKAILNVAVKISRDLPAGTSVAIIDFSYDSDELNAYVINGLHGAILRNRRITSLRLDQEQLGNIREELHYNASGELSVESAQNNGRRLGVQYLITGSIERIDSDYLIIFNAVDTYAHLQSQYSSPLNPRNDAQLASFLGSTMQSETASQMQAQNESEQEDKLVSLKFSLGEIISISWFDATDEYQNEKEVSHLNHITLALNLRLLFSPWNKLRLGIGIEAAFLLGSVQIDPKAIVGNMHTESITFAPYWIVGYGNYYLHTGYDFWSGALYIAPVWAVNNHLLICLPMSLFGSDQNFRFPTHVIIQWVNYFKIGLSIQYVF